MWQKLIAVRIGDTRARLIASETVLTWRQVVMLAHQYAQEQSDWRVGHWLLWGPIEEVGDALWNYWMEQARDESRDEDAGDPPPSAGVSLTIRQQCDVAGASPESQAVPPFSARGVGQQPKPWW